MTGKLQEKCDQMISAQLGKSRRPRAFGGGGRDNSPSNLTSELVDLIISTAANMRASDIHIEPIETKVRVRFRIDGRLHEVLLVDDDPDINIMPRIKILANMPTDTMSQKKALDGRFTLNIGSSSYDFRVATFPTVLGEKIAIRILNKDLSMVQLEKIGLDTPDLKRIERLSQSKHGLLLVSGPTGSGKTTTLYAILNRINVPDINIVALEDPVEYQIKGMNQCDIRSKADFNFANGLRAVLRQDPDIVLVGEIRDNETAEIAIRASITGHLVCSTIHANSAIGTILRLVDMGLERYLVAHAIIGALAQRLVRRICEHCRTQYAINQGFLKQYNINPEMLRSASDRVGGGVQYLTPEEVAASQDIVLTRGQGCEQCNSTGYRGRLGIFEIVVLNDELRTALLNNEPSSVLRDIAVKNGTKILSVDALQKVKKGLTTLDEVIPVVVEG